MQSCEAVLLRYIQSEYLQDEQELYKKEGLGVKNVKFVDNQVLYVKEAFAHGSFISW